MLPRSRPRRGTRASTSMGWRGLGTASANDLSKLPPWRPCGGSVGPSVPRFEASFTPCVEVGYGYTTEAAHAATEFGFTQLGLKEIVAFTVPDNTRSVRVMEKLGMEFGNSRMAEGHPLRPSRAISSGSQGGEWFKLRVRVRRRAFFSVGWRRQCRSQSGFARHSEAEVC